MGASVGVDSYPNDMVKELHIVDISKLPSSVGQDRRRFLGVAAGAVVGAAAATPRYYAPAPAPYCPYPNYPNCGL